ncbi:MAG: hypothetical protein CM15mP62_24460 [Rhodospirillaceae bacterium]|nr:MAG: hypothetical protein CM15mP62_24460 [Rhodospirillaceae bacterium]
MAGSIWRANTRAKTVILATNAYTDNLWPGLKQTFTKLITSISRQLQLMRSYILFYLKGMDFGIQEKLCFPYEKIFMADSL